VGRPSTHFCSVRLDADPGYLVDLEELEHAHKNVLRVPKLDTSRNLLGEQDEHADPHLVHEGDVGKIEHDFLLADWLSFHPNLEVVGALPIELTREEEHPRDFPYRDAQRRLSERDERRSVRVILS